MSFISPIFLIFFLPISLLIYLNIKDEYKNILLLFLSLIFYFWCGLNFLILILISSTVVYLTAYLISKTENTALKRFIVILSILYSLLVLIYYKYLVSIIGNTDIPFLKIISINYNNELILPLGISFYTFSIISYILDIYWGKCNFQKNIINSYLYILFFPKITQGPIMRYSDFEEQINNRSISSENIIKGCERFMIGMVKKIIIADPLIPLVNYSFMSQPEVGTITSFIGIFAFLIQLYFDFSGYSDMAIGIGNMFGIKLPENFNYPYTSKSVTEYWRKWHITLGHWFRDYVYMPIFRYFSTSDISITKNNIIVCDIIALLVVWILNGIWHGNGLKFLIYGLWWFVFIVYERIRDKFRSKIRKKKGLPLKKNSLFENIIDYFEVFVAIIFGQVIFNAQSLDFVKLYFNNLINLNFKDGIKVLMFFDNTVIFSFVFGLIFCFPVYKYIKEYVNRSIFRKIVYSIILILLFFIAFCYSITDGYNAFLYEIY